MFLNLFFGHSPENAPVLMGGLPSYKSQLNQIRSFLCANPRPSADVVQRTLGHGIKAGKCVTVWVCMCGCEAHCVCAFVDADLPADLSILFYITMISVCRVVMVFIKS